MCQSQASSFAMNLKGCKTSTLESEITYGGVCFVHLNLLVHQPTSSRELLLIVSRKRVHLCPFHWCRLATLLACHPF